MTGPIRDARLDGIRTERARWIAAIERRAAQHRENIALWQDDGLLVPTEPDGEERARIRERLAVAINELERLAEELGAARAATE